MCSKIQEMRKHSSLAATYIMIARADPCIYILAHISFKEAHQPGSPMSRKAGNGQSSIQVVWVECTLRNYIQLCFNRIENPPGLGTPRCMSESPMCRSKHKSKTDWSSIVVFSIT